MFSAGHELSVDVVNTVTDIVNVLSVCVFCSDGGAGVRASSVPGPAGQGVSERRGPREEDAPLQHSPQSPL